MEARPPALRAKGCLGPPTVILAGNGPVQLSATHTSAPSVPITARKLSPGVVPICVGSYLAPIDSYLDAMTS